MSVSIHQVLPVLSAGDAIGAATLRTRDALRRLGFGGTILADVIDPSLAADARPAAELDTTVGDDDVVLYRLSIGSPLAGRVARLGVRRVVVYHNITPARYYRATNERVTYWLERGREELRLLSPLVDLMIGDSSYNLAEAVAAGARQTAVVPPFPDFARLRPRASVPVAPPEVLFVGRLAPNKRHDTLLRAIAALRAGAVPDARLRCVGTASDTGTYRDRLLDLAGRLGVADAVDLGGERTDDATLGAIYAGASVFATASQHEGFCVPLVEAMAFSVPIVAAAEAAIPETAGAAGLLLDDRDPLVWAEALGQAIRDQPLRAALVDAGRRRLADFSVPVIEAQLGAALASAGITPRGEATPARHGD